MVNLNVFNIGEVINYRNKPEVSCKESFYSAQNVFCTTVWFMGAGT